MVNSAETTREVKAVRLAPPNLVLNALMSRISLQGGKDKCKTSLSNSTVLGDKSQDEAKKIAFCTGVL